MENHNTVIQPTELRTPEEVSKQIKVTVPTLQVWRSTKRYNIPYVKIGGRVMYRLSDIEAFIARRTVESSGGEF